MSVKGKTVRRFVRLHTSDDIEQVKRQGKQIKTEWFNLVFRENSQDCIRVAVIVGRRFGRAVVRNRTKRRFRELARMSVPVMTASVDLLVFPKRAVITQRSQTIRAHWNRSLRKAGLLSQIDCP
ncbi:MAG: ribonuclease P protein component [Nitrospirae bacterium]|nr:MAG: ribonuclease P protein component [Nitrospirota bacterium]